MAWLMVGILTLQDNKRELAKAALSGEAERDETLIERYNRCVLVLGRNVDNQTFSNLARTNETMTVMSRTIERFRDGACAIPPSVLFRRDRTALDRSTSRIVCTYCKRYTSVYIYEACLCEYCSVLLKTGEQSRGGSEGQVTGGVARSVASRLRSPH
jgi:hypothetical protein